MIHYYAVGGGLGHLTRGRRVLEALGLEATFITASAYAADARVTGGLPVVLVPSQFEGDVDGHRSWLRALAPERLIVDTFPGGIQGELCGLDVPMDLVARRLRWAEYRRAVPGPLPHFGTVWVMEDLDPEQDLWSAATASCRFPLPLEEQRQLAVAALHTYWLIVHSGPEHEVRELVAYAEELLRMEPAPDRILVATRCPPDLPPGFELIDTYPVHHLFPAAQKIISAAGFNIMSETDPWRDKHHPIPFPRPFDDQFARAAARKTAARYAGSVPAIAFPPAEAGG